MLIAQICFRLCLGTHPLPKKYQPGPDKVHYSVNFGLGPHLRIFAWKLLRSLIFYVISFDESLNKATQSSQMDLMVRYFDKSDNKVHTRYVTSAFLGACQAYRPA